jgi:hypothetical protein
MIYSSRWRAQKKKLIDDLILTSLYDQGQWFQKKDGGIVETICLLAGSQTHIL